MDPTAIHQFISQHRYAVISSLGPNNTPQSALIGVAVSENLEIIFDTVKSSRKYSNLIGNPNCSLVIGWENEQTLQYEGIASEPIGEELTHYRQVYFQTWPDGPARLHWPGLVHLVIRPTWLRYSDFNQFPPQIFELTFPLSRP
jgi:pyridoxamine 5'-phosphate oxidase-like protein